MATRKRTSTTYGPSNRFLERLSFWLVIIIGAAMSIVGILHVVGVHAFDEAGRYIQHVCFLIGMFVPVCLSYRIARYKSTLWFVLWIIFTILIVVGIVTSIIN